MSDWARELGVNHSDLVRLRNNEARFQNGPLMRRLIRLFAALDEKRAHWEQRPARRPKGRPWHILIANESFKPSTMILYADFQTGRMQRRAWTGDKDHAVSA